MVSEFMNCKLADRMKLPANGTMEFWDAGKASVVSQGITFTKKAILRRKVTGNHFTYL